ncbi:hypothetical protein [uncultured Odoribacter sp.]|uniref:hypothetical protein n=1 Tax=uncultured Odoribacter sp. TaxID=876416 RepID=UPI002616C9F5|nr:hypothetical protein [uncultured Odoribacter sp.]
MNEKDVKVKEMLCGNDFVMKSLAMSRSAETDEQGRKNYHTVFVQEGLAVLYVDLEGDWEGEKEIEAELRFALFQLKEKGSVCLGEQISKLKLRPGKGQWKSEVEFQALLYGDSVFSEGIYGIVARCGEKSIQSEPFYVIEGKGDPASYFRVVQVGVDKCCPETEEEAKRRAHSYSCLDISGLESVCFYFLAENQVKREWVYEFVIQLTGSDGWVKVRRIVRGKQFVQGEEGKLYLCFTVDLGEKREHFWEKGEYTIQVFCFEKPVLRLNFEIGDKDIPYAYPQELYRKDAVVSASAYSGNIVKKEEVLDQLYRLVGLRKVKEEITRICEYADFIQMRRKSGFSDDAPLFHMLFTGCPSAGKNTVAEIIGQLFCSLGILSNGKVNRYGRDSFLREGYAAEEQLLRKAIKESEGGILFIDRAGELYDEAQPQDRGRIVIQLLLQIIQHEKLELIVILSDTEETLGAVKGEFPEIGKYFPRQLCFEKYSLEEWMEIARQKLEKRQYRLSPAAADKFFKWLKKQAIKGSDFADEHFIDDQLEIMVQNMAERLMGGGKRELTEGEMVLIREEDIMLEAEESPKDSLERLTNLVGASQLKKSIIQHLNYVYFLQERRKQGYEEELPPLHMVFGGNPGTGKLTVAKMLGEIYYSAGILSRPAVIVQNVRNFAGNGNISPEQVIIPLMEAAEGGILYLENAASFLETPVGISYFEGVLSFISPEVHQGTIVILADYPEEVEKIFQTNPGIKDYFPYRFDFMDYTREELFAIIDRKLKEKKYILHPRAREAFGKLIDKAFEVKDRHFGNALWVERLVNTTIHRMSERLMHIRQKRELTRKELTTVMTADIPVNSLEIPEFVKDNFDEEEIDLALKELDQMVGQGKIKKQIHDFVDLARHYSQQGIKLSTKMSLQWCFTGNSGMGKRAMARVIAHLYKAMGLIEKNVVYDFKADKLIGRTEEEAHLLIGEALRKANGGILLFDEDSEKLTEITGIQERIRALLADQLAIRPGSCIIIYASRQSVLQNCPGEVENVSDLINVLVFEDYTTEELMRILRRKLEDERLTLTSSARQYMLEFTSRLTANPERSQNSARLMRIVAELMIRNSMQRLAKNGKLKNKSETKVSVVKSDVLMFNEDLIRSLMNEKKKIGFNKE